MRNPKVRQALCGARPGTSRLAQHARCALLRTGIVTNLRLAPGQYVAPGQPLLSFLESGPRWISADLRENQLGNVRPGQDVTIALDILPANCSAAGSTASDGASAKATRRRAGQIVRHAGRRRLAARIPSASCTHPGLPDEAKEAGIDLGRSGAQANVLIFTSDKSLLNPIGKLWIKIVALLSYLQ
jgi:hypothetical protein